MLKEYKNWAKDHPKLVSKEHQFKIHFDRFIDKINKTNQKYYMFKTEETATVIMNNVEYRFKLTNKFPQDKMNIFRMVRNDAEAWLKAHPDYKAPKVKSSVYNIDYPYLEADNELTIGVDIKHAFWRIAYLEGIITEKTYEYGMREDCKAIRLASLSVLGRPKYFYRCEKGERISDPIVIRPLNIPLNGLFHYVRNVCYHYMSRLSALLGNDFFCYKVDEIHFHNTKENIETVISFFETKKLLWTLLDNYEEDEDTDNDTL